MARIESRNTERTLPKNRWYEACYSHRCSLSKSSWYVRVETSLHTMRATDFLQKNLANIWNMSETWTSSKLRMYVTLTLIVKIYEPVDFCLVWILEKALQRFNGNEKLCVWLQLRLARKDAQTFGQGKRDRSRAILVTCVDVLELDHELSIPNCQSNRNPI